MRGDGLFTFDIHTRELKPVEGVGNIVMSVQRAADGSIETTAAMIEAGNKGMTTLKNVTVQNSNTTASGVIVNKSNGQLTLNDVKFVGCKMIVAEARNIAARRAASTDTSCRESDGRPQDLRYAWTQADNHHRERCIHH